MSAVFTPDLGGQAAQPIALAGGVWLLTGTVTFAGSYATGGDAFDLRKYSPAGATLRRVHVISNTRAVDLEVDLVNQKLKVWTAGTAPAVAEHTAAAYDTDLTATPVPIAMLLRA